MYTIRVLQLSNGSPTIDIVSNPKSLCIVRLLRTSIIVNLIIKLQISFRLDIREKYEKSSTRGDINLRDMLDVMMN